MKPRNTLLLVLLAVLLAGPAHAAFTYSGDVYPADPTTWVSGADSYVGFTSNGSLTVSGGSALSSLHTILGFYPGVTGTATVSGAGSTWNMGSSLYAGFLGTGNLNVTNGGTVNTGGAATLGVNAGSTGTATVDGSGSSWTVSGALSIGTAGTGSLNITNGSSVTASAGTTLGSLGTINFGTNGGTLTTSSLAGPTSQILGTGTLVTNNWTGDFNLVVDGITPTTQTVGHLTGTGQNVAVKLDIASNSSSNPMAALSVGYQGSGSLTIRNGQSFFSTANYVGNLAGANGTATVNGSGSAWNAGSVLYLGYSGTGSATIANGGIIATATAALGRTRALPGPSPSQDRAPGSRMRAHSPRATMARAQSASRAAGALPTRTPT